MSDFDFLSSGTGGFESSIVSKSAARPPLIFKLDDGQNASDIANGLRSLNEQVIVQEVSNSAISVILPPTIKLGEEPVDLRTVALTLKSQSSVSQLDLIGDFELCCGNGGGCCVNSL